jgi:hypothetical protein
LEHKARLKNGAERTLLVERKLTIDFRVTYLLALASAGATGDRLATRRHHQLMGSLYWELVFRSLPPGLSRER